MSRRPAADRWAVIMWHKEGLSIADICHKTGFERRFVSRWINKFEKGECDDGMEDAKHTGRQESGLPKSNGLSRAKCEANDAAQVG